MNFVFTLYIQTKLSFYWTFLKKFLFFCKKFFIAYYSVYYSARFEPFCAKLSLDISEHEHSAALYVYVNFAAERYVAKSARIAGGENQLVKRIFEILRI